MINTSKHHRCDTTALVKTIPETLGGWDHFDKSVSKKPTGMITGT